jgi:hypothetical protein
MSAVATMARLAAATLVANLTAGLLLVLFLLSGPFFDSANGWGAGSPPPSLGFLSWLPDLSPAGVLLVLALPAFFAGAAMTALERRHSAVRRPGSWAAAGAGVGAIFFLLANIDPASNLDPRFSSLDGALAAAFLIAGAVAALAFRAVMWLSAPFDPGLQGTD